MFYISSIQYKYRKYWLHLIHNILECVHYDILQDQMYQIDKRDEIVKESYLSLKKRNIVNERQYVTIFRVQET